MRMHLAFRTGVSHLITLHNQQARLPPSPPTPTSGCMAMPVAHTHVPKGSTLSASSPLRFTVRAPGPTRFTLQMARVGERMGSVQEYRNVRRMMHTLS